MLSLTLLNIILRSFQETLLWIEPLVRHLVFLSCFLGASLASGENKHIRIDLLTKFMEQFQDSIYPKVLKVFINFVSLIIIYFLIKSGLNFYDVETEYSSEVFLGIGSEMLVLIIPVGFGVIFIQTLLASILVFKTDTGKGQ